MLELLRKLLENCLGKIPLKYMNLWFPQYSPTFHFMFGGLVLQFYPCSASSCLEARVLQFCPCSTLDPLCNRHHQHVESAHVAPMVRIVTSTTAPSNAPLSRPETVTPCSRTP